MRVQYLGPIVLAAIVAVLGAMSFRQASDTSAFEPYLTAFNTKYGTAATKLNSCGTCHEDPGGGGPRNAYGTAFELAAGTTDQKFTAIEGLDSDGDTFSNVDEITARTWPGDATDFPGATTPTPGPTPTPIMLMSEPVVAAPVVDGDAGDAAWSGAAAVTIHVANGGNLFGGSASTYTGSTDVSVKSVYTNDHVYFLLDYSDPTQSLRRMPWQKQADGSWLKLSSSTTHQENTYYEDKVAFLWDIAVTGFADGGCATACHAGEQPAGSGYGNMYTANAGEKLDMWHWKSVRTDPNNQADDQYMNSDHYDPVTAPDAGRHSDPRTGGGYSDNVTLNAQGDVDCSGGTTPVSAVDALKILRKVAGLSVTQTEPCTDIDTMGPPLQGDVDCNGTVTAVDALKVFRKVASLSVTQQEPCFDIGVKGPRYTSPDQEAPPYWILDADKQPFTDTYSTNDEIAGIITQTITGDRGDIQGKGIYNQVTGHWVLEIGRPLTTGSANDVQFDPNAGVMYPFGMAVFDNASVNHAYQSGVSKLHFVVP